MIKKYSPKIIGAIAGLAILWSATESQWSYSIKSKIHFLDFDSYKEKKETDIYMEIENIDKKIEDYSDKKLEEKLIKIETLCPEHQWINNFVPASKDPRVIYFWNREINTNKVERNGVTEINFRHVA